MPISGKEKKERKKERKKGKCSSIGDNMQNIFFINPIHILIAVEGRWKEWMQR
jgi:hypothetical protein